MIYTTIDTFYLSDDQLKDSPSRKDGIDEETETALRIYGCDLIQEGGILLRLPQAVMATGQVLFHRFYCKKSFVQFNVKRVAASCVWLAAKLEETQRRGKHVIIVFHRMECRRENLPIEHLDLSSKKYAELRNELIKMERHLLKEMGFICHVEHPHKFISNYLAVLETPPELRQLAWNMANDSLRTTLCVRFKSEVVACGVIYAAARKFNVPLPEDPPWWTVFDADEAGIQEVCRVLARLYSLPKARYIAVDKGNDRTSRPPDSKETNADANGVAATDKHDSKAPSSVQEASSSKSALIKAALDRLKGSKKSDDEGKAADPEATKEGAATSRKREKPDYSSLDERPKGRETERSKARDHDGKFRDRDVDRDERGRDSDREQREYDRGDGERERKREQGHYSKERNSRGHSEKRHHSARGTDHGNYYSSHSSREKDRHRRH